MNVVVALKHNLKATLLVLQRTILVFIEVTDTDELLVSIKFKRNILSTKASFCLKRVSFGLLYMTASFELDPNLSWLIDCQI